MSTVQRFKLVSELADVFQTYGGVPTKWEKRSKIFFINQWIAKYCKFKAIEIYKALSKGETPRRGGPKDEEDENAVDDFMKKEDDKSKKYR